MKKYNIQRYYEIINRIRSIKRTLRRGDLDSDTADSLEWEKLTLYIELEKMQPCDRCIHYEEGHCVKRECHACVRELM